jgi:hypothetical protein
VLLLLPHHEVGDSKTRRQGRGTAAHAASCQALGGLGPVPCSGRCCSRLRGAAHRDMKVAGDRRGVRQHQFAAMTLSRAEGGSPVLWDIQGWMSFLGLCLHSHLDVLMLLWAGTCSSS